MKRLTSIAAFLMGATLTAFGLDGQIGTHDPSTVMECNGRFYCYGTGDSIPIMICHEGCYYLLNN